MIITQSHANEVFEQLKTNDKKFNYRLDNHLEAYKYLILPITTVYKRYPDEKVINNTKINNYFRDDFHYKHAISMVSQFCLIWDEAFQFIKLFLDKNDDFFNQFSSNFFESKYLDTLYKNIKNNCAPIDKENLIITVNFFCSNSPYKPNNNDIINILTLLNVDFFSKEIIQHILICNIYNNPIDKFLYLNLQRIYGENCIIDLPKDFTYKFISLMNMIINFEQGIYTLLYNHRVGDISYCLENESIIFEPLNMK